MYTLSLEKKMLYQLFEVIFCHRKTKLLCGAIKLIAISIGWNKIQCAAENNKRENIAYML